MGMNDKLGGEISYESSKMKALKDELEKINKAKEDLQQRKINEQADFIDKMTNFNSENLDEMKQLQDEIEQMQKDYMEKKKNGEICDHDSDEEGVVGGRLMEQLELLMIKEKVQVVNQKIAAIMAAQTKKYIEQSDLSRELTENLDTDGDGKVDNVKDEKRFFAVLASLKSIKFDLAKRDADIAKLECEKKDLELRLARIQVTTQGKPQGNWVSHLSGKLAKMPT